MKTRAGIPRGRFPVPLDDVLAAYRIVRAQSPRGVILGGASAGACLAAAATLGAIDEGLPPVGVVLTYGFFHAVHRRTEDVQQRATGHRRITHSVWALNAMNRNYAGSQAELANRLAFPGGHDVHQFPRTLSINAEKDNMRASGDTFAAELSGHGVDVQHHVLLGTRHAFLNRPGNDAFATAVSVIAEWSLSRIAPIGERKSSVGTPWSRD
ncbi:alpha/beta hydrolase [Cryobacterium frigoriphilum]|nr:alpha/beta hydrolase fold domain-containing protein [Cryobacterium frigoriphilum]